MQRGLRGSGGFGGLGRPLRDVLEDAAPEVDEPSGPPRLVTLFGQLDEARVEAVLGGLREALAAAFPADVVVSRYALDGFAPVIRLATPGTMTAEHVLDLARGIAAPDTPALVAQVDVGCPASVSVRRPEPSGGRPFDHDERRRFTAIVDLVAVSRPRRPSPL